MFDVNELEREYRGFINQLRNGKKRKLYSNQNIRSKN